ncbi:MAG: head-tail connector protein [Clostridia bacterium]|nr:head-tail connector protein [Clostridia bacterium]
MLEQVKKALRIMSDDFDDEITLLIDACIENLQKLGVNVAVDTEGVPESAQIRLAVIAYCKWQFGNNEDKDQWREIYDRKLAEMKMMTGLTTWESTEA